MSIVHGTPKRVFFKLCPTEKFWLLKHFYNKHLLNKTSKFITKYIHVNKLLLQLTEKG